MSTQEVDYLPCLANLFLSAARGSYPIILDGGGPDSWGLGEGLFTTDPRATLEVFATGWGRWVWNGSVRWNFAHPWRQWNEFLTAASNLAPQLPEPDAAGVLSVLSYDLKHWVERLPRRHPIPMEPVLFSAFYDWTCVTDHRTRTTRVSAQTPTELYLRATQCSALAPPRQTRPRRHAHGRLRLHPTMTRSAYRHMVLTALDYIAAGDIYQVNLAQRFHAPLETHAAGTLFHALVSSYPMPFAACVDVGSWVLVSNSPECLLQVDGECVATFPIKGTGDIVTPQAATRRPFSQAGQEAKGEHLADDPKERAEHLMIVDLERNDLGRVCECGSVLVRRFATIHSFPLLRHLVSRIEGRLIPGTTLPDVMRAVFPGGSVTGAPKIRAMQIIEELEPCPRGFYTGAIGWTDLRGQSRFNLMIRTAWISEYGLDYYAGGGIVADSDPDREYEETLLKSEAFFRALAAIE